MEGNLRGARQSLVVSPTLTSIRSESALSHQLAATRERDRRLYAGQGPIPPRIRPYYSSPLSSNSSPGHSRGMSETSVPFIPAYTSRILNKRASSAMGAASGPWVPEGFGQGRFPIRESRSLETVRDPRQTWVNHDERDPSLRSYDSRDSRSPPTLETLPEDETSPQQLLRPSSTTGDLRAQMQDLKGRISSLKQKAKEDTMRRRSLQSLRTPSPFTCAETWYAAGDAYKAGASPVTADAGIGTKTESPVRKTLFEEEEVEEESSGDHSRRSSRHKSSRYSTQRDESSLKETSYQKDSPTEHYNEDLPDYEDEVSEDALDDDEFVSVNADNIESGGDSVYEDALYEIPVTERHEDRIDAFDYEHFFLHSAMGSYSSGRSSRSSSSSADSVETTRPTPALYDGDSPEKRISMHQRNASVDSVSTVATFATAAEEQSDDEDEQEQELDQFSQRLLPSQQNMLSHHTAQNGIGLGITAPRSDSAINIRNKPSSGPQSPALTTISQISLGSSQGSDLASGLQTSKIYNILLEAPSSSSSQEEELRVALSEEEKQLIYGLAASFQQVCARLQSTAGDRYERKEWRRRLDEARRVLSGEEPEGRLF